MANITIVNNLADTNEANALFDYTGPAGTGLSNTGGHWGWDYNGTPSSGTGPAAGYNYGYIYTEASSPTASGDEFVAITKDTFDLSSATLSFSFYYNANCNTAPSVSISVWDGFKWNIEDTFTPEDYQLQDTWYFYETLITSYTNSDAKIKLTVTMPSDGAPMYRHDIAFDVFKIEVVTESDPIIDYFSPYGITKYRHGSYVFNGEGKTDSELLTIINNFISDISSYTFANYPNGVIVKSITNKTYLLKYNTPFYTLVENDLVTIDDCENLVGWTTNGLNLDRNVSMNKSNSISGITNISSNVVEYTPTTTIDLNNKIFRTWIMPSYFVYLDSINPVSITFNDGINEATYNIISNNSKNTYKGGWINATINTLNTPDSGIVDLTTIASIKYNFNYNVTLDNHINTWVDFVRYGNSITLKGGAASISDLSFINDAPEIGYGMIENTDDNYVLNSNLIIGGDINTDYTEYNVTIDFDNEINNNINLSFVGDVFSSNTFNISNVKYRSNTIKYDILMNDPNITLFKFTYNTVYNAKIVDLLGDSIKAIYDNNAFIKCDKININGSKFTNNIIVDSGIATGGAVHVYTNTDMNFTKNIRFLDMNNICIVVDATVTELHLDNIYFEVPDASNGIAAIHWLGTAGTLTINNLNGTNITLAGISTLGGTVVLNNISTITLETIDNKLENVASDVRAIKVVQGENMTEMETIITTAAGVRLVL